MKTWWSLVIVFLVSITNSFTQEAIIKGTVKDEEIALNGATVSIKNKATITNFKGEFSIMTEPGKHILVVTHSGYKKWEKEIVVTANPIQFMAIELHRAEQLGEVVVLGSRSAIQRSNLNTSVPLDVISSKELRQTAQLSLIQMMNFAAPSFNTSRQNLFEPVTLRGLGPDHLLVLLNGTRYHSTAYVNSGAIKGTLGLGAVTNDLSSIPFSAIEKIEILRDGASAQYGSDAIAGVMNIVLKKTTGKTFINLHIGEHYKGDGESTAIGINHGIALNKKGYLNFSGDFRYRKPTHRGGEYEGTVYYNAPEKPTRIHDSIVDLDNQKILERGFNRKTPVSNAGSIQISGVGFLVNGGYHYNKQVELFWTGSINYRYAVNRGMYRFPKSLSQVNTDLYPDGFKVKPVINSRDISAKAGARGTAKKGWKWEWNSTLGWNSNKQIGKNTNNPSQFTMGASAPTEFYGGRTAFIQQINGLSFTKDFSKKIKSYESFVFANANDNHYQYSF